MLVLDDSGDRKDGTKTAHVGHQWLGRYGKTDNGVVTVTTVWADERLYYPVHAVPYTPARHFAKGKNDPAFRTKLAIGADLAVRARAAGFAFPAVAADSAYGDQDGFRSELSEAGLPFVMALKPRRGTWAYGADAHTPVDAARELAWGGPDDPGDWHPVTRTFRDGHAETWWAAEATLGWWGPDGARRLVAATADPGTLPAADFQVRSDIAIRRRQVLVNCAFRFCWDTWFAHAAPPPATPPAPGASDGERGPRTRRTRPAATILAPRNPGRPRLAGPLDRVTALVDRLVERAPAPPAASPDDIPRGRQRPAPLHPKLTNYR